MAPISQATILILGAYTALWGLWLVNPFWTVFSQAGLYSQMAAIMPEWCWGSIAIVAGIGMVLGALKGSADTKHPLIRYRTMTFSAMTGCLHWLVIGILYMAGDIFSTGGITSLTFAIYAAYIYVNIRITQGYGRDE